MNWDDCSLVRTGPLLALMAGLGSSVAGEINLTLGDYLSRVLAYNENIQIKILETEISRKQYQGAKGIFEPVLVTSLDAEDRRRALTEEQKRNLFFATIFNERNKSYDSAVELLIPTGAKIRVGYNLRKLNNNLNSATFPSGEYLSTVGVTLTQPLLKDAFDTAVMANIRAAAVNSDITFQEYRKALIEVVARAEAAYWDVFLAQQQYSFSVESLGVAHTVFQDNKARLAVGKSSELDVLQAEAGVAERTAIQTEAQQKLYEAVNRAMIFYSGSIFSTNDRMRAVDEPKAEAPTEQSVYYRNLANDLNPDYMAVRKQLALDEVRIAFAKNQVLPQLDLKGSYGASGVAGSFGSTFRDLEQQTYPSWMVGLELKMPLGGNIKGRQDLYSARLRKQATQLSMQTLGVQLDNTIDAAFKSALTYFDNIKSYAKIVDFNQNLLKTQLARLEVGKIDSRTVLETEKDLFEAKLGWVQSLIRFKRAFLDLEQSVGLTLKARNLEISQSDLAQRTRVILQNGHVTTLAYERFLEKMRQEYERRRGVQPTSTPKP